MFYAEPPPSSRFEIEDYIRACQHLMYAATLLHRRPLTNEEAEVVEHHRRELVKVIALRVGKH